MKETMSNGWEQDLATPVHAQYRRCKVAVRIVRGTNNWNAGETEPASSVVQVALRTEGGEETRRTRRREASLRPEWGEWLQFEHDIAGEARLFFTIDDTNTRGGGRHLGAPCEVVIHPRRGNVSAVAQCGNTKKGCRQIMYEVKYTPAESPRGDNSAGSVPRQLGYTGGREDRQGTGLRVRKRRHGTLDTTWGIDTQSGTARNLELLETVDTAVSERAARAREDHQRVARELAAPDRVARERADRQARERPAPQREPPAGRIESGRSKSHDYGSFAG
eukprot:GHVU01208399.1.p1 GENE.GHVU01208399.1~~GHVU01208399.1.p1  ORF type:complete len:277 (+),score=24.36 GHVU01208399.1:196-1026(+)